MRRLVSYFVLHIYVWLLRRVCKSTKVCPTAPKNVRVWLCGPRTVKVGVLRESLHTARIWTFIFLADCTFHGVL